VPVRRILKETGFEQVWVVPEQEAPDPGFPTVKTPNPEERDAFTLAIRLAAEKEADLIIATDPDCDRLGVAVRDGGNYTLLNGNQVGCLLQEYILSQRTLLGTMPPSPFVVKTIVTSEMSRPIAARYHVEQLEVLTGFKFIGEKILQLEENGNQNYVFGFEESYGYLAGSHARDKDGVVAAMLVVEMAAWHASRGMSLLDGLHAMYEQYGYYLEEAVSIGVQGKSGLEMIASAMTELRNTGVEAFGDWKVARIRDYRSLEMISTQPGSMRVAIKGVPPSDVLYYEMENTAWVCVRPSGTEPKIKIYFGVCGATDAHSRQDLERLKAGVMSVIKPLLAG
jgi:phosphoglucomutase